MIGSTYRWTIRQWISQPLISANSFHQKRFLSVRCGGLAWFWISEQESVPVSSRFTLFSACSWKLDKPPLKVSVFDDKQFDTLITIYPSCSCTLWHNQRWFLIDWNWRKRYVSPGHLSAHIHLVLRFWVIVSCWLSIWSFELEHLRPSCPATYGS